MSLTTDFDNLRIRLDQDTDKIAVLVAASDFTTTVPLPQSVYDAVANPAITSVKVSHGRYTLPTYFNIQRPNLDLDWNGSTIFLDGPVGYPFHIDSKIKSFVDPASPTRNASHLTGTITASTTQLTMDAAEVQDLVPGEIVTIFA